MKDILQYKGFIGSVHFSAEDECFFGKIEGINDLVTFEAQDVKELKKAFQEAVEDYKELCKLRGKSLEKSYKGSFNVRITPELHKKAVQKSLMLGISLNQLVQKAIEEEVEDLSDGM
ncbi:MAG: type II toxin-antitoxin system HicB family antitoxin [Candidatus Aminicenantes bacterium]|nr:type II toxin-antitoxin system HicB family antitoxin [Candidatus Aminicenantes bacterium]MDH5386247.1 type II toxin-antitoxin system HicB family antitoxin [Candidatus Aminicenantes bacterium]